MMYHRVYRIHKQAITVVNKLSFSITLMFSAPCPRISCELISSGLPVFFPGHMLPLLRGLSRIVMECGAEKVAGGSRTTHTSLLCHFIPVAFFDCYNKKEHIQQEVRNRKQDEFYLLFAYTYFHRVDVFRIPVPGL